MDSQTRKLNLISYLAQLQDENLTLRKIYSDLDIKSFTEAELLERILKSEEDFKIGKFKTQNDLEQISVKW